MEGSLSGSQLIGNRSITEEGRKCEPIGMHCAGVMLDATPQAYRYHKEVFQRGEPCRKEGT